MSAAISGVGAKVRWGIFLVLCFAHVSGASALIRGAVRPEEVAAEPRQTVAGMASRAVTTATAVAASEARITDFGEGGFRSERAGAGSFLFDDNGGSAGDEPAAANEADPKKPAE